MRNRLRSRVGVAQVTSLAVVGVGIGLIAGFMFMSLVDTVSRAFVCDSQPLLRLLMCVFTSR